MDLKYISSNDNIIEGIALENSSVIVKIELWDGKKIEVEFINYAALKEKNCVGIEIGDIIVDHSSTLMSEVFADMLRNGGKDDLNNIKLMYPPKNGLALLKDLLLSAPMNMGKAV